MTHTKQVALVSLRCLIVQRMAYQTMDQEGLKPLSEVKLHRTTAFSVIELNVNKAENKEQGWLTDLCRRRADIVRAHIWPLKTRCEFGIYHSKRTITEHEHIIGCLNWSIRGYDNTCAKYCDLVFIFILFIFCVTLMMRLASFLLLERDGE